MNVYSGNNGGLVPTTGTLLADLQARGLVSANIATSVPGFNVTAVTIVGAPPSQIYSVTITCPTLQDCGDVANAKSRDTSVVGFPAPIPMHLSTTL